MNYVLSFGTSEAEVLYTVLSVCIGWKAALWSAQESWSDQNLWMASLLFCICTMPSERAGVLAGEGFAILEHYCEHTCWQVLKTVSWSFFPSNFLNCCRLLDNCNRWQVKQSHEQKMALNYYKTLNRISFNRKDPWIWVHYFCVNPMVINHALLLMIIPKTKYTQRLFWLGYISFIKRQIMT